MSNLIINRVFLELMDTTNTKLYVSKSNLNGFHKKYQYLKSDLKFVNLSENQKQQFSSFKDDDDCYYSFFPENKSDLIELNYDQYQFQNLKIKLIREILFEFFKHKGYLVSKDPGYGVDLSVYEKIEEYNTEWDKYRRYDFKCYSHGKELGFVIGSESTLISKIQLSVNGRKFVINNTVYKNSNNSEQHFVIADKDTKKSIGFNFADERKKLSYKEAYKKLNAFYHQVLLKLENEQLKVLAGGLKTIEPYKVKLVSFKENKMLFGNDKTDINPVSGLRNYGIYRKSPLAEKVNFIFIYKDSSDANTLFMYLKNGLKHFPGLLSYVGIPITRLDKNKSLQYIDENDLRNKIYNHIEQHFPESYYDNYFAIIIEPFSKTETEQIEDDEEDELYYLIKGLFLNKGIPTQFIHYKNIHKPDFHYHLPNIAIAILAKLRGIPWKLKSPPIKELIIGYNSKLVDNNRFLGSAVYFSNDGLLGRTAFFPQSESSNELIVHLRNSIEAYISENNEQPERLIIHYFKAFNSSEKERIENLIKKEFQFEIPYALVEINDTKSTLDVCFDINYEYGMPLSGTYIQLNGSEYLLFNNNRYEAIPPRSINDELPIKIKIHFADTGGFSHAKLISQIYEFSRLYWRSLKQKSQPVTTVYSKYIAEFRTCYSGEISNNDTVNYSPWFL